MATIDTIAGVLESNLDIDPATVTPEATFESLGIDSLDMVELICDLEEACEVDFGEPEGLVNLHRFAVGRAKLLFPEDPASAGSFCVTTGDRPHNGTCEGSKASAAEPFVSQSRAFAQQTPRSRLLGSAGHRKPLFLQRKRSSV